VPGGGEGGKDTKKGVEKEPNKTLLQGLLPEKNVGSHQLAKRPGGRPTPDPNRNAWKRALGLWDTESHNPRWEKERPTLQRKQLRNQGVLFRKGKERKMNVKKHTSLPNSIRHAGRQEKLLLRN